MRARAAFRAQMVTVESGTSALGLLDSFAREVFGVLFQMYRLQTLSAIRQTE
jgi:hypothetical protein